MCFSCKSLKWCPNGQFFLASCSKTGVSRHSIASFLPTSSAPAPPPPRKPITP